MLDQASNWLELAEDAERDAAKAGERSKQLREAARIFRENAESKTPWPLSKRLHGHTRAIR